MITKFNVETLGVQVLVSFARRESTARRQASKALDTFVLSEGARAFYVGEHPIHFVWFGPDSDVGVVYHEAWHLTKGILREIGSEDTDEELSALLHENLVINLMKKYERYHKQ